MEICKACKSQLTPGAKFCPNCGAPCPSVSENADLKEDNKQVELDPSDLESTVVLDIDKIYNPQRYTNTQRQPQAQAQSQGVQDAQQNKPPVRQNQGEFNQPPVQQNQGEFNQPPVRQNQGEYYQPPIQQNQGEYYQPPIQQSPNLGNNQFNPAQQGYDANVNVEAAQPYQYNQQGVQMPQPPAKKKSGKGVIIGIVVAVAVVIIVILAVVINNVVESKKLEEANQQAVDDLGDLEDYDFDLGDDYDSEDYSYDYSDDMFGYVNGNYYSNLFANITISPATGEWTVRTNKELYDYMIAGGSFEGVLFDEENNVPYVSAGIGGNLYYALSMSNNDDFTNIWFLIADTTAFGKISAEEMNEYIAEGVSEAGEDGKVEDLGEIKLGTETYKAIKLSFTLSEVPIYQYYASREVDGKVVTLFVTTFEDVDFESYMSDIVY